MTILDDILAHKRVEVARSKERVPPEEMTARAREFADEPRGFRSALARGPSPSIIAELKRRSPSKGEIRKDFDASACATALARGGAAALSVLTDERFFGGGIDVLVEVRRSVGLPLLRKDFILDPYQIDEARSAGADAVLLIVKALDDETLARLHEHATKLGLDVLVEVHDEQELARALSAGANLVGVNNRDLRTFEVDLGISERVGATLSSRQDVLLVAESGILILDDIRRLERAGAQAFLVGESLMREPDLEQSLKRLRGSA
jgi:indole-3-glycerol phosphate synthase